MSDVRHPLKEYIQYVFIYLCEDAHIEIYHVCVQSYSISLKLSMFYMYVMYTHTDVFAYTRVCTHQYIYTCF